MYLYSWHCGDINPFRHCRDSTLVKPIPKPKSSQQNWHSRSNVANTIYKFTTYEQQEIFCGLISCLWRLCFAKCARGRRKKGLSIKINAGGPVSWIYVDPKRVCVDLVEIRNKKNYNNSSQNKAEHHSLRVAFYFSGYLITKLLMSLSQRFSFQYWILFSPHLWLQTVEAHFCQYGGRKKVLSS